MPALDSDPAFDPAAWVGRVDTATDVIGPTPLAALRATLDHPAAPIGPGDPLPPLWHWLFALPLQRASDLGDDGHARRDAHGFLPPFPLPRRMWAGSDVEFVAPVGVVIFQELPPQFVPPSAISQICGSLSTCPVW